MNNGKIIHRRIDEKAILTMIALAAVGLMVMAYRYTNSSPCIPFHLTTRAGHYITGEVIRFETDLRSFETLHWSFGDNQDNDTKVSSAVHAYDQPGEYVISLTANRSCTEYTRLVITPAPRVENPALIPAFICPQSAEVGKPVRFSDTTAGAAQWQWRFGETATVDATDRAPQYTYTTPGLKTVSVVINDDQRQTGICKIYVNPAAPPKRKDHGGGDRPVIVVHDRPATGSPGQAAEEVPKPEPVVTKAPEISSQDFENQLRAVANKFKTADNFSPYLCGNLNIQVNLNGEMMSFTALCNKFSAMKSEKKIKKLSVQLVKNDQTGCVVTMFVNLKEKEGLFNKIF